VSPIIADDYGNLDVHLDVRYIARVERMFNVTGKKKTEWYEPCKFATRPATLQFKCRFYHVDKNNPSTEFYDLSGDDPALYLAENCMAMVEMEWVQSKKQYRLAKDAVRMLNTKLGSLS
jgi:hypothetical protein